MKHLGGPQFAWPEELCDPALFRNEFVWHLARVKFAAANYRRAQPQPQ
jgi:hypothetical protein